MLTFLCITNCFKGVDFLKSCHAAGNKVYLITSKKDEHKAWPRDILADVFLMDQDETDRWNITDLVNGLAHFMKGQRIDRVVALDDFDVEAAAHVREHFRIPGMGETTSRFFRDKLAMRVKARDAGIPVPAFSSLFHDEDINKFIAEVEAPWMLKPRGEASADGIQKIHSGDQLWEAVHKLGDRRHHFLVEQFKPGAVYHADALTVDGKVKFCRVSRYLSTPMEVAHGGGIFRSVICKFGGADDKKLQKLNAEVMKAFGMQYSASHTEFIKNEADGKFYFLETASRVGGAHLAEMVEASSGINLWGEWARIETAKALDKPYKLPKVRKDYAGIVVSLSRFEHPDNASFRDEEIVWRLDKKYHIGLIIQDKKQERILELLDEYAGRIGAEFHAKVER